MILAVEFTFLFFYGQYFLPYWVLVIKHSFMPAQIFLISEHTHSINTHTHTQPPQSHISLPHSSTYYFHFISKYLMLSVSSPFSSESQMYYSNHSNIDFILLLPIVICYRENKQVNKRPIQVFFPSLFFCYKRMRYYIF